MNSENENDGESPQPLASGWRKYLRLGLAGLFLILGVLGAILPVLPATPFLLLASYHLVRSYPKLNEKLLRSRLIGPILTDWQVRGGVKPSTKYQAIVVVLIAVGLTCYFSYGNPWIWIGVILLAAIGLFVILRLPIAKYP